MRLHHKRKSDGVKFTMRKCDGVRVHHEKKSDGVRIHYDKKSDGVRVYHNKEGSGESLP